MSNEFLEQQNPSDNFGNAPNPNSSSHDNPGINDHDDQNSNSNKRDDRDRGPPARFFYRFLFPSALTGLVVGKGGQLVKSLRDRYQCDIYIKETKGPERMMRFKADCAEDIANCI